MILKSVFIIAIISIAMIGVMVPSVFADEKIPTWVKDIFLWYEEDQISEDDLINVIRFLASEGIVDLDEKSLKEKILSNEISNEISNDAIQVPDLTISPAVGYEKYFTKHVNIFGIPIYATSSSSDAKVLHAANVLAQYLDNNADGIPDNPLVVEKLKASNSAIPFFANEADDETSQLWDDFSYTKLYCWTALYADETNPSNHFDAALEEILHMITQCGYANAYPEIFAEKKGSALSNAMSNAMTGQSTWYHPFVNDSTMPFQDQHTEYIYWALTSILGAQENRDNEVYREWELNTKQKVKDIDPDIFNLLTDPQYRLPTVLPDGNYNPIP